MKWYFMANARICTFYTGTVTESSANEFFVAFSVNNGMGTGEFLQLFVTTPEPQPVNFVVSADSFSFIGTVTSNSSTTVNIPQSFEVTSTDDREKGIRVKAEENKNLVVYGLSYQDFTSDAFLALPCQTLPVNEYEYYAVTYTPLTPYGLRSFILVVACEDNTIITTPDISFTLNRQQTYQIESTADLTGTRVTASKPVALFGASECSNIPFETFACDHLTEQIPPTATWGSRFLVASLLGRDSGERFRVVSSQGATVTVKCSTSDTPTSYSLPGAGSWSEFEIVPNSYCSIEASSPVYLAQYSLGLDADFLTGDPFMMMIPPIEQYSNSYVFEALQDFVSNLITVYVTPEYFQPQRILLDGVMLDEWVSVSCALDETVCGYIVRVSVSSGEHLLFHQDSSAQVGVSVYGFNFFNSYGYPGGLRLTPVQCKLHLFNCSKCM